MNTLFLIWLAANPTIIAVLVPLAAWSALLAMAFVRGHRPNQNLAWIMGVGAAVTFFTQYWVPGGLRIFPCAAFGVFVWIFYLSLTRRIEVLAAVSPLAGTIGVGGATFFSMLAVDFYGAYTGALSGASGWGTDAWYFGVGGSGVTDALFMTPVVLAAFAYACFKIAGLKLNFTLTEWQFKGQAKEENLPH